MAPRHAARPHKGRRASLWAAAGAIVVAAVVVAVTVGVPTETSTPPAAAATHGPMRVIAITPGGAWVSPDAQLRVIFTDPLATGWPAPTITPAVQGRWVQLSANAISFRPARPMNAGHSYRVVVPASTKSTSGATLHVAIARRFTVAMGSTLRMHQVLAELGYLPVHFVPTGPYNPASAAVQRGMFSWRWRNVPTGLTSLWQPGVYNVITKGAIMRFEDVHGLATDGLLTPGIWNAVLHAAAKGQVDPNPYDYVDVNTAIPQTLTLYSNNRVIYRTLVNSGISSRPTAIETDPVYLRYVTTTMSGTNPDGSHYSDPGIPWVSYFHGGEALHGYIRYSYGWPQSLGCIEMPYDHAKVVWPYTPIGTLVTVR